MKKLITLTLCTIVSAGVFAKDCNDSNADMGQLESCKVEQSYKSVETLYQKLLKTGSDSDLLQATQTTWKSYRDATCDYVGDNPTSQAICLIDFNNSRAKTLQKYISQIKN